VISATLVVMPKMTVEETTQFLDEPGHLLRLGTVDTHQMPSVVPIWFLHRDNTLWFTDNQDQRLRRCDLDNGPAEPIMLTPEPAFARGLRWADGRPTNDKAWYVCVRETHREAAPDDAHPEPTNEIVAVAGDGSMSVNVLVTGPDFVSTPRLSPDNTRLSWIQWDHPDMPWDATQLWVADFADGQMTNARPIAGVSEAGVSGEESILEPEWTPGGNLHAVTDRHEWWNLWRWNHADNFAEPEPMVTGDFEIATPHWVFNMTRHAMTDDGVAPASCGRFRTGCVVVAVVAASDG